MYSNNIIGLTLDSFLKSGGTVETNAAKPEIKN